MHRARRRRSAKDRHDNQVIKSPAYIIILCEANDRVEAMLKDPSFAGLPDNITAVADPEPQSRGSPEKKKLAYRHAKEHFLIEIPFDEKSFGKSIVRESLRLWMPTLF